MDTIGEAIVLDPGLMDDVSARFLTQAEGFHRRIGGVREAMSASDGGRGGWGSVASDPVFGEILEKHRRELRDAETFIASVAEDVGIMGRNTRALKQALLGEDGDNADVIDGLYSGESGRSDGGEPVAI